MNHLSTSISSLITLNLVQSKRASPFHLSAFVWVSINEMKEMTEYWICIIYSWLAFFYSLSKAEFKSHVAYDAFPNSPSELIIIAFLWHYCLYIYIHIAVCINLYSIICLHLCVVCQTVSFLKLKLLLLSAWNLWAKAQRSWYG